MAWYWINPDEWVVNIVVPGCCQVDCAWRVRPGWGATAAWAGWLASANSGSGGMFSNQSRLCTTRAHQSSSVSDLKKEALPADGYIIKRKRSSVNNAHVAILGTYYDFMD